MITRTIEEYLKLPYTIEVVYDEGDNYSGWFAKVVEWPGCMTQADNFEELGEMIVDAMRAWAETALEEGIQIPEPRGVEQYSGKFVVRVPKSLHHELVDTAEREGVSLNAYVSTALGKAVGKAAVSHMAVQNVVDNIPTVNWPRLSEQARRLMLANGLKQEVQEVDEKMFAGWIEDHLYQIRAATQQGYYREALQYVQSVRHSLETLCDQSPVITTYCLVVSLLEEQISENTRLREGLIEQNYVRERIVAQTRKTAFETTSSIIRAEREIGIRENNERYFENDEESGSGIKWARRSLESK